MLITCLILLMVLCNHSYKAFGASYFCSMLTSLFFFLFFLFLSFFNINVGLGKGRE